jgi:fructuronate reductase
VSLPRLSRAAGHGRPAPPVRLVHLGLGNFFRAHQCWYTEHAADADGWGFDAFTRRRSSPLVDDLTAQDGLYTLVSRASDGDRFEVIGSMTTVHQAADHEAWLRYLSSPEVVAATVTVTEAGYLRGPDGGLDTARAEVRADLDALRHGGTDPIRTAPGRLVAGLAARRRADAGPFTLVPCDNTPATAPWSNGW